MYKNVSEFLLEKIKDKPFNIALEFIEGDVISSLSYQELYNKACAIASQLRSQANPGERAIIACSSSLEFNIALFACSFAGMIAVPCPLPSNERLRKRLVEIIHNCQAKIVISDLDLTGSLQSVPGLIFPNRCSNHEVVTTLYDSSPRDLMLLQYSSGTTGKSKGVMLSHENVIHNCKLIHERTRVDQSTKGFCWLPSFHDMGLINGVILPIYVGYQNRSMRPLEFMRHPLKWLKQVSSYKANYSGGPNYAYQLCLHIKNDIENLDLSSWEVAFCGAEPIQHQILLAFYTKFSKYGFKKTAFAPCYGLAESTVYVSGKIEYDLTKSLIVNKELLQQKNTINTCQIENSNTVTLVSSGLWDEKEQDVKIVDLDSLQVLADEKVGRIFVKSNSIGQGYWDNQEATNKCFNLTLNGNKGYLDTGDLGFIYQNELIVTGRIKDVLIINGANYYPQTIENLIENSSSIIRPGATVIQLTNIDFDSISVVIEVKYVSEEILTDLCQTIMSQVFQEFSLKVSAVYCVKPHFIPKTTSGKISRYALQSLIREENENVLLTFKRREDSVSSLLDPQEIKLTILDILNEMIGIDKIDLNKFNVADLFDSSLKQVELVHRIESALKITCLSYSSLQKRLSLNEFINYIVDCYQQEGGSPPITIVSSSKMDFPLLPMPAMILNYYNDIEFNLGIVCDINISINFSELSKALNQLIALQPVLRATYSNSSPQTFSNDSILSEKSLHRKFITLEDDQLRIVMEDIIKKYSQRISVNSFPLFHLIFVENSQNEKQYLIAIFSHLIVDPLSIHLFFQQLSNLILANRQLDSNEYLRLEHRIQQEINSLEKKIKQLRENRPSLQANFHSEKLFTPKFDEKNTIANEIVFSYPVSSALYKEIQKYLSIEHISMDAVILGSSLWALKDLFDIGNTVQFMHNGRTNFSNDSTIDHLMGWFSHGWPLQFAIKNRPIQTFIKGLDQTINGTRAEGWDYNSVFAYHEPEQQHRIIPLHQARIEYSNLVGIPTQSTLFRLSSIFAPELIHGHTFDPNMRRYRDVFIRPILKGNTLFIDLYIQKHQFKNEELMHAFNASFRHLENSIKTKELA